MTIITVSNPYYEKTYRVDMDKQEVLRTIYEYGNEDCIPDFEAKDEYGKECTIFINRNNFASVIVMEGE